MIKLLLKKIFSLLGFEITIIKPIKRNMKSVFVSFINCNCVLTFTKDDKWINNKDITFRKI